MLYSSIRGAAILAAVVVSPELALGQEASLPEPGTLIRIVAERFGERPIAGQLVEANSESLTLEVGQTQSFTVPWREIEALQVAAGRKSRAGRGAAIGFAFGFGMGALAGAGVAIATDGCASDAGEEPCPIALGAAAGLGVGAFGALVGAAVGGMVGSVEWEDVPLPNS